ncbi:hypothetical protein EDB86DRAFT_1942272 [Lactarius hatsudake]|nr:hypothetical protein EDB86DRAFT_1942272 [Lactarius hatsudake]
MQYRILPICFRTEAGYLCLLFLHSQSPRSLSIVEGPCGNSRWIFQNADGQRFQWDHGTILFYLLSSFHSYGPKHSHTSAKPDTRFWGVTRVPDGSPQGARMVGRCDGHKGEADWCVDDLTVIKHTTSTQPNGYTPGLCLVQHQAIWSTRARSSRNLVRFVPVNAIGP